MTSADQLAEQHFWPNIRPRQRLSVSAWADSHRILSPKASSEAGQWKTSRTPYLKEIMDCLSASSPVSRVVMMFGAQIGKTEVGLNWIGYVIHHAPAPMLCVVPTIEVRNRWVKQRLNPMFEDTDELVKVFDARRQRDRSSSLDVKDFPGGMLVLGGANSPASLASMPIRYVLCDEVDRFPWEVGREGDPLGLIDQRTATFPRRKVLLVSTPTIKGASRIEDEYEQSDQRRYRVPCPDCGERQTLKWANLTWNLTITEAWYTCEHCGVMIREHEKPQMLAHGTWIAERPERTTRGYHLNGLYAPIGLGFSWLELARHWAESQDDQAKLKRFINTTLGEAWEDRSRDIKPNALAERAEPYPLRAVPPGALVITAGVDVQGDRLALQLVGWGRAETCWILDYVELPGDPSQDEVWGNLTELLNRPLVNAFGKEMTISATAIDTGGHHTHDVYQYVRTAKVRRLMAIKGSNTPNRMILSGRAAAQDINWRGKVIKGGAKLWMIGVDTAKHVLANRLYADSGTEPSGRKIRFSEQLTADYYAMLTAEAFDPERNRWVKRRGRRNEALDTWVYALAAAHHPEIRVHAKRQKDWSDLASMLEPGELDDSMRQDKPAAEVPPPADQPKPVKRIELRKKPTFATRW